MRNDPQRTSLPGLDLPAALTCVLLFAGSACAACTQAADSTSETGQGAVRAQSTTGPGAREQERDVKVPSQTIGTARMQEDGTIVLQLRATGAGATGDARIEYGPSHESYQEVLRHLGGLAVGEEKQVPPWPE